VQKLSIISYSYLLVAQFSRNINWPSMSGRLGTLQKTLYPLLKDDIYDKILRKIEAMLRHIGKGMIGGIMVK